MQISDNFLLVLYFIPAIALLMASIARTKWGILILLIGFVAGAAYNVPRFGGALGITFLYELSDEPLPAEKTLTLYKKVKLTELQAAGWHEQQHAWVNILTTLANGTFLLTFCGWRRGERKELESGADSKK